MMQTRRLVPILAAAALLTLSVWAGCRTPLINRLTAQMSDLPRYTKLPLFDPHRKTFTCLYQGQHVPPIDPQAELWFQQALALDDPNIWYENRDWKKIYQLYVQAAERNHWKAMLNLASLVLSGYPVPEHDPEAAIRWIEKAMTLGVPDAWDRMGVYHQNGLIKGGDTTSAYAFFQKAADMGSPAAMTFLGDKLGGTYDDPEGDFWGNRPIAVQMLQCAMAQGDGDAAYELSFYQKAPNSIETKSQALKTLHEGAKLGSANCAKRLSIEFDGFNLSNGTNLVGHVDKARAERYGKIGDALDFWQGRLKLPNLDKVLPLPPAPLPKWDGNKQTLIDAAKAVTPPGSPGATSGASLQGREQMPDGYGVMSLSDSPYAVTGDRLVPESGYWLALSGTEQTPKERLTSAGSGRPERYSAGERFEPATIAGLSPETVQWHYLGEARVLPPSHEMLLAQRVRGGQLRQLTTAPTPRQCGGLERCPQDGIWQGRVSDSHPQAFLYNTAMQQTYVHEGERFPDPRGRSLNIDRDGVVWSWLGSPNADSDAPGSKTIVL